MKALAGTHHGVAPVPVDTPTSDRPADDPPSRFARRLVDLQDQPTRFPSDVFAGRGCITKAEWERRHEATYGQVAS